MIYVREKLICAYKCCDENNVFHVLERIFVTVFTGLQRKQENTLIEYEKWLINFKLRFQGYSPDMKLMHRPYYIITKRTGKSGGKRAGNKLNKSSAISNAV